MPARPVARWGTALVLGTLVAGAARRRNALSGSGAAGAAAVGTAVFGAAGVRGSALLLLFFGSSTALSRLHRRAHHEDAAPLSDASVPRTIAAGPRRTLTQVLANGGLPAVLALTGGMRRDPSGRAARAPSGPAVHAPSGPAARAPSGLAVRAPVGNARPSSRWEAAYAGALAAANADTWATEIGRLSRSAPRMITTGRRAEPGVSGAITPLGTTASLGGALVIGLAHAMLFGAGKPSPPAPLSAAGEGPGVRVRMGSALARGLSVTVAGFAGALADSVLGATVQAVYVCRACGQRTEDRTHAHGDAQPNLARVRGLPLMTNDAVNLCASLTGAGVAAALSRAHGTS